MAFQITTFQPPAYDSAITTVWDLAQFNVAMQGGLVISGQMTFNGYTSKTNIGNPAKVLYQKTYALTAAEVSAFQTANNLAPGQIATLAYGLAESIQDVPTGTVDANNKPVMASFFAGAEAV